jgi:hypothetical protein
MKLWTAEAAEESIAMAQRAVLKSETNVNSETVFSRRSLQRGNFYFDIFLKSFILCHKIYAIV